MKDNPIALPVIAVVGSQSAGKSSVLENIVGHSFLPRLSFTKYVKEYKPSYGAYFPSGGMVLWLDVHVKYECTQTQVHISIKKIKLFRDVMFFISIGPAYGQFASAEDPNEKFFDFEAIRTKVCDQSNLPSTSIIV